MLTNGGTLYILNEIWQAEAGVTDILFQPPQSEFSLLLRMSTCVRNTTEVKTQLTIWELINCHHPQEMH